MSKTGECNCATCVFVALLALLISGLQTHVLSESGVHRRAAARFRQRQKVRSCLCLFCCILTACWTSLSVWGLHCCTS